MRWGGLVRDSLVERALWAMVLRWGGDGERRLENIMLVHDMPFFFWDYCGMKPLEYNCVNAVDGLVIL